MTLCASSSCSGFREATKRKNAWMAASRTLRVATPFFRSILQMGKEREDARRTDIDEIECCD